MDAEDKVAAGGSCREHRHVVLSAAAAALRHCMHYVERLLRGDSTDRIGVDNGLSLIRKADAPKCPLSRSTSVSVRPRAVIEKFA
jgi:hypothetical protein